MRRHHDGELSPLPGSCLRCVWRARALAAIGEYGHQRGELNFWLPLTDPKLTRTTLWVESHEGAADDAPLDVGYGEIAAFHGSVCSHHVPANESRHTCVSLDFRVGVEGFFDPHWSMKGTKEDHGRRKVVVDASR